MHVKSVPTCPLQYSSALNWGPAGFSRSCLLTCPSICVLSCPLPSPVCTPVSTFVIFTKITPFLVHLFVTSPVISWAGFAFPSFWPLPCSTFLSVRFSSVGQSCLTLCDPMNRSTPGLPVHHQPKLMSIESVMPSSHLILCRPLLLLPPIPPSIRVFSNESALCTRWPKYWSFSFSISRWLRR